MTLTQQELAGIVVLGVVVVAAGSALGHGLYDALWSMIDAVRRSWRDRSPSTVEDPAPAGDGPIGTPNMPDPDFPNTGRTESGGLVEAPEAGGADLPERAPAASLPIFPRGSVIPVVRAKLAQARWWSTAEKIHLAECRFAEHAKPLHFVLTSAEAQDWAKLAELEGCGHCDPLADPASRHARHRAGGEAGP